MKAQITPWPTENLDSNTHRQLTSKALNWNQGETSQYNEIITNNLEGNRFRSFSLEDNSQFFKLLNKLKIKQKVKAYLSQLPSRLHTNLNVQHSVAINDRASFTCFEDEKASINNKSSQFITPSNTNSPQQQNYRRLGKFCNEGRSACWQQLQKYWKTIIIYIPIINPSDQYKLVWDVLQLLLDITLIFLIPIYIIFDLQFKELISMSSNLIIILLMLANLLLGMTTGYFEKGLLITDRQKIIANWCQNQMQLEVLSNLPLIIILFLEIISETDVDSIWRILTLLYFLKLNNLVRLFNKISETYSLKATSIFFINMLKLLGSVVIIGHMFASIWLFMGQNELSNNRQSWLTVKNLEHEPWQLKYLYSYYYSCVTMTTIGYGDITPTTSSEMIVCIILMFLACGVFGYNINTINYIFESVFRQEEQIKKNFILINNYMKKKKVSAQLQCQIRDYLDYIWRESTDDVESEEHIITQLSDVLRDKLYIEANKVVLIDSPIFSQNFSQQVISKTVSLIKEYKTTPGEIIFMNGDQDDCAIYFIEKGSVEVFLSGNHANGSSLKGDDDQSLLTIGKGGVFGEVSFFTGKTRSANIRSLEFTSLLVIRREDFLNLVQRYSQDLESFCHIKDRLQLYQSYQILNQSCSFCNKISSHHPLKTSPNLLISHQINTCPYVHYLPRKQFIYARHNFSQSQVRVEMKRRHVKFQSIKNNVEVLDKMDQFQMNNSECLDKYESNYFLEELENGSNNNNDNTYQDDEFNTAGFEEINKGTQSQQIHQEAASADLNSASLSNDAVHQGSITQQNQQKRLKQLFNIQENNSIIEKSSSSQQSSSSSQSSLSEFDNEDNQSQPQSVPKQKQDQQVSQECCQINKREQVQTCKAIKNHQLCLRSKSVNYNTDQDNKEQNYPAIKIIPPEPEEIQSSKIISSLSQGFSPIRQDNHDVGNVFDFSFGNTLEDQQSNSVKKTGIKLKKKQKNNASNIDKKKIPIPLVAAQMVSTMDQQGQQAQWNQQEILKIRRKSSIRGQQQIGFINNLYQKSQQPPQDQLQQQQEGGNNEASKMQFQVKPQSLSLEQELNCKKKLFCLQDQICCSNQQILGGTANLAQEALCINSNEYNSYDKQNLVQNSQKRRISIRQTLNQLLQKKPDDQPIFEVFQALRAQQVSNNQIGSSNQTKQIDRISFLSSHSANSITQYQQTQSNKRLSAQSASFTDIQPYKLSSYDLFTCFDIQKSFAIYFPYNNMEKVLQHIKYCKRRNQIKNLLKLNIQGKESSPSSLNKCQTPYNRKTLQRRTSSVRQLLLTQKFQDFGQAARFANQKLQDQESLFDESKITQQQIASPVHSAQEIRSFIQRKVDQSN